MSLKTELDSAHATLTSITGTPEVIVRASKPPGFKVDTTAAHIILDVIPGAPEVFLGGEWTQPLILQIGVWHPDTLTAAIEMHDDARAALKALNYDPSAGSDLQSDDMFHGVVFTMRLEAALGS